MDIKSLTLKNILKDDNGEEYFDLSVPSFNLYDLQFTDVHLVTKDEEGRMDKICESYYGNSEYMDVLCFINHMFNPFSVEEGDLLIIPEISSYAGKIYAKPEIPSWISGEASTGGGGSNKPKTNEKDQNRVNRIKQQKAPRKTNELPEGKQIKKYVNGKIILGTHLNTNGE